MHREVFFISVRNKREKEPISYNLLWKQIPRDLGTVTNLYLKNKDIFIVFFED